MINSTEPVRPTTHWVALVVVGLVGGLLSGAFGVGGGIVMVPLLLWLAKMDEREASVTSLSAVFPASIVGSIAYLLHGEVQLVAAAALIVGAVPGALLGSWLVHRLHVKVLRWLFIALLVGVAVRTLFVTVERGGEHPLTALALVVLVIVGVFVGTASGLFGVGGGIIVVPALVTGFGFADLVAKGTSLVVMIVSSGVGSVAHARRGSIHWRTTIIVAISAIVASYGGVLLALWMSPRVSTVLFAVLMLLAALQLIVRALRSSRSSK
ncbi:sulfite exporter TauE/SafE family protein [soil metagenome]